MEVQRKLGRLIVPVWAQGGVEVRRVHALYPGADLLRLRVHLKAGRLHLLLKDCQVPVKLEDVAGWEDYGDLQRQFVAGLRDQSLGQLRVERLELFQLVRRQRIRPQRPGQDPVALSLAFVNEVDVLLAIHGVHRGLADLGVAPRPTFDVHVEGDEGEHGRRVSGPHLILAQQLVRLSPALRRVGIGLLRLERHAESGSVRQDLDIPPIDVRELRVAVFRVLAIVVGVLIQRQELRLRVSNDGEGARADRVRLHPVGILLDELSRRDGGPVLRAADIDEKPGVRLRGVNDVRLGVRRLVGSEPRPDEGVGACGGQALDPLEANPGVVGVHVPLGNIELIGRDFHAGADVEDPLCTAGLRGFELLG